MSTRRDEILDVGKDLFAERGFAATSMRDIAQANGVMASTLYSHFRSKSEMLERILVPYYELLVAEQEFALSLELSGLDRLLEMVKRVLVTCTENDREMKILLYSWPQIRATPDLADIVKMGSDSLDRWRRVVEIGIKDGSIRRDVDADVTARLVTSAFQGVIDPSRYEESLLSSRGVGVLLRDINAIVRDGVGSRSDGSKPPTKPSIPRQRRAARPTPPAARRK